jgi:hypothetical protein
MKNVITLMIVGLLFLTGLASANDTPRVVQSLDTEVDVDLTITPLTCKRYTELTTLITRWYMDGKNADERTTALVDLTAAEAANDDRWAATNMAMRFDANIVSMLGNPVIAKQVQAGVSYPDAVNRATKIGCAGMVGKPAKAMKRNFAKAP